MYSLKSFSNTSVLIAPSVLAADFTRLGEECRAVQAGGAEILHLDVMDAHFVPNLSFGPPLISALRPAVQMLFDVHLMISHPLRYITDYAQAGADHITFHLECEDDTAATLAAIRAAGCSTGLSIKPGTPYELVAPWMDQIDMLLIMSVEPGFGGQKFMPAMLDKVKAARRQIQFAGLSTHIEVDGGIGASNAGALLDSGANVLVAGTSIFRHKDGPAAAIKTLRECRGA